MTPELEAVVAIYREELWNPIPYSRQYNTFL
jgi:hypothetical protein